MSILTDRQEMLLEVLNNAQSSLFKDLNANLKNRDVMCIRGQYAGRKCKIVGVGIAKKHMRREHSGVIVWIRPYSKNGDYLLAENSSSFYLDDFSELV